MDRQRRGGGGFLERLLPAEMNARELHRRKARAFGILAAAMLLVGLGFGRDALGIGFAVVVAAVLGVRAAYHVREARRMPPDEQVALNVDGLPAAERGPALRRILWLGGGAAAAMSVWSGWALWSLETGRAARVELWGPVGLVYRTLGFWPAMLTCPALGVLIVVSVRRKLRDADAAARDEARRSG